MVRVLAQTPDDLLEMRRRLTSKWSADSPLDTTASVLTRELAKTQCQVRDRFQARFQKRAGRHL